MVTKGRRMLDLVDDESGRREQHALIGQPHGGVGFAVYALQINQLKGLAHRDDGHPVVVLDVRRDESVAFQGRPELRRRRGEALYAIRRIAFWRCASTRLPPPPR